MKIFDTKRLRVRKLTPKEYGILQAFPMDDWKQVVSDSQAYKQFGNAVTTTVFTAIAEEIAKSIYAAEESEEQNMEAENKNFTGMNEPEEKPTAESILAAAEAEAAVLEAVGAEVLEEQPASERTPAAAMTLMREIKVLRFIGDDPFLFSMGNFLEELTGPCLFGMGEELLRGCFLDHDAVFHKDGAGRDVAGEAHLMGDDQHGHALLC